MRIGLNFDLRRATFPPGPSFARFPLWRDDVDRREWFDALSNAGVESILVFDSNAFLEERWAHHQFRQGLQYWQNRFPDARFVEAGNEPDGTGDESSAQSREDFYRLISEVRELWPAATIISGGLVRIGFEYLEGLAGAGADVAGFHPYDKTGVSVQPLIRELRQHTDLPLWATEFGRGGDGTHERAEWFTNMILGLWRGRVDVACVYRYDNDGRGLSVVGTESEAAILDAVPNVFGPPPAG